MPGRNNLLKRPVRVLPTGCQDQRGYLEVKLSYIPDAETVKQAQAEG